MNENQDKKKGVFDRRPFGIPKRYIFCVVWCLTTIATWFITHAVRKTLTVAICGPVIAVVGIISLFQIGMILFLMFNTCLDALIPPKCRRYILCILISLWVALPLYVLIVIGSVQVSLILFVVLPILVFMVLWFLAIFGPWIGAACEVQNPILRIFAIIGVLLFIGLLIASGISSKDRVSDDYDQYDRRDPTYFRR